MRESSVDSLRGLLCRVAAWKFGLGKKSHLCGNGLGSGIMAVFACMVEGCFLQASWSAARNPKQCADLTRLAK